jgi:hypothetical protein
VRTENLLFAGKISFDFPDRTINFLWRDDMFSTRGRYIFPWRTALLPELDAKISLRGRQFFLGRTIGPRPKISQERRYSFPRRTIFCCVHAQELRVRVLGVPITPRISSQARRYAPGGGGGRSLVVRERDDMGTLGPQCFPEGTILAVELACRSRATGAGVSAYRPPGEGRRHYYSFQNTPCLLPKRSPWLNSIEPGDGYIDLVRSYMETEPYRKAVSKRKVWIEPLFAEGKLWHGMRRFRTRTLGKVNSEALMTVTGQNIKRLLASGGGAPKKLAQAAALRPPDRLLPDLAHHTFRDPRRRGRVNASFFNKLERFRYNLLRRELPPRGRGAFSNLYGTLGRVSLQQSGRWRQARPRPEALRAEQADQC